MLVKFQHSYIHKYVLIHFIPTYVYMLERKDMLYRNS